MTQSEKILGIDPGTARMGYGIIRHTKPKMECVEYGTLTTNSKDKDDVRLDHLYNNLLNIIDTHNPDYIGVESIYYFTNQKTIIHVSQARGIALLAAAHRQKTSYSFTPLQVKQAVAGYGQAQKEQVQKMVQNLLVLENIPKPDDAADALAVAICCAESSEHLIK